MNPLQLFMQVSMECSKAVTRTYSTSFFSSIKLLHPQLREPVFGIYGFVRLADEIVDSFHDYNKPELLRKFRQETACAIEQKISLNPVLHSFQTVVNKYHIPHELIDAFFHSMEMDLDTHAYHTPSELDEYIYGSAEVVGLMCLCIFCEGDHKQYNMLKPYAQALGAAFQKVNFLRDFKDDYEQLNRTYFPGCDFTLFNAEAKESIESCIEEDFKKAYKGILLLPLKARFGVYVAYKYYYSLFKKIKKLKPENVMQQRIRIPNYNKAALVLGAHIVFKFNMVK